MTVQRFETGPRMSQVVVHGNTVYLAGVVAGKAAGKSVTEQTQDILSIIDGHLAKAGTDKSKLLSATIYITDMKTFPEMNAVWDGWVSAGNTPAARDRRGQARGAAVQCRDHGGRGEVALLFKRTDPPFVMAGHSRLKDGVASARLCPAIHVFVARS